MLLGILFLSLSFERRENYTHSLSITKDTFSLGQLTMQLNWPTDFCLHWPSFSWTKVAWSQIGQSFSFITHCLWWMDWDTPNLDTLRTVGSHLLASGNEERVNPKLWRGALTRLVTRQGSIHPKWSSSLNSFSSVWPNSSSHKMKDHGAVLW